MTIVRPLPAAKIMKTESRTKENFFFFMPRCIFSYVKIMKTEGSAMPRCIFSLPFAFKYIKK